MQHLESLIKENYPSVRLQTSNQPVDFTSSAVEITTDSVEGWTIVPSRKPTVCELIPRLLNVKLGVAWG